MQAARGKNLVMRERTCDIAGNYSTFVKCGMTNQKDKHCFIVGGVAQDSKCELLSEDGIPVWNSIDQSSKHNYLENYLKYVLLSYFVVTYSYRGRRCQI